VSEANASDETQSFNTRTAHEALMKGLDDLKSAMENASIERKIEVGSILWEVGDRLKEVLDAIKADVRVEAVRKLEGNVGTTKLDGDDVGSATVLVPSATLRIPKSKDIASIKSALGSRFPFFFEETVTYKPSKQFEDRVEEVTDALEQKILLESVERQEHTPRVSFRRDRPPRGD